MQIKREVVLRLVETLSEVDKVSRRKNLTPEDVEALNAAAIRAIRSTLTTLRKLP